MKTEEQPIIEVAPGELIKKVEELSQQGYRMVQMHCTKLEKYEVNYSFDKDYKFVTLRLMVTEETEIPSITGIYWGAFLYENEIRELFGVKITGTNVDFGGHLYKKKIQYPFRLDMSKGGDSECQSK
jgi:ech hydrogenase subunit D